ncbi:MAG: hypothetical protein ACLQNE_45920 [Thermoguttaceae bacterium]
MSRQSVPTILRARRSFCFWPPRIALAMLVLALLRSDGVCASGKMRIQEDFHGNRLDLTQWSVEGAGARSEVANGRFEIAIPAGPAGRPPFGLQGHFKVEGDFEIRAGYAANSLPMPKKDWVNVAIFIEGPSGVAAVMRTNHSKEGAGYSMWSEPPRSEKRPGVWKQVPTTDQKGVLCLQRTGATLRFLVGSGADGALRELGTVEYGAGSVENIEFRVVVPETASPVEVAWDKTVIEADKIIGAPKPALSMFGPRAWMSLAFLACAVGGGFLYWKTRQKKPAAPPPAPGTK